MVTRVDPEALPPDPEFEARRGPAVAAEQLTAGALRARFARLGGSGSQFPSQSQPQPQPPPQSLWQVEQESDGGYFRPEQPLRPAAVLIGLVGRPQGAQLLFTVRSENLNDHAGQISFPGGRVEASDRDPSAAALREAHEEIGLDPRYVEVLGTLPVYRTISGYEVTPVVGWIDPDAVLHADPLEVEEFFEVPLAFLMNGANHMRRLVVQGEHRRGVYAMEYFGRRRYLIWGATAAMLRNFYRFVLADIDPAGAASDSGAAAKPLQSAP
jgi:8-oxo-dGTP pyrophosphatase MutT (NUDIX family)